MKVIVTELYTTTPEVLQWASFFIVTG